MFRFTTTAFVALTAAAPALAQESLFQLDEIVFSAGLTALEAARAGVSVDVVTAEDLQDTGDVQLASYLARLPGVTITQNGPLGTDANLRIRGAGSGLIAVYVDGILVNDPTATSGGFNGFGTLLSANVQRVELLRGSQSAIYGGSAVGGVLSITTGAGTDRADGTTQSLALEAGSYGTVSGSYALSQRSGPLTLDFGISHARTDGFSAAEENNGNTEADPGRSSRLSFGAAYEVTEQLTLGVNGFVERGAASFDEFGADGPEDGTPGDDTSDRALVGLRAFAEFRGATVDHRLSFSYLQIERNAESVTPFAFSSFTSQFNGERRTASYVATTEAFDTLRLSFGADWREDTAEYANLTAGSETITTTGAFAEAIWSPSDTLDVVGSLRAEDNSSFGQQITGRLAVSWRATSDLTLRGAVANGYRPPSVDELFGVYPSSGPFRGNPDLTPETSLSAEVGMDYAFANGATIGATLFYLAIDDLITFSSCGAFPCPGDTFSTLENVAGTSVFQGIEMSGAVPLSDRMTLTGAYTYTDAEQANGDRVQRVPRHDLALGLDAALTDRLDLSANMRLIADSVASGGPGDNYTVFDASIGYAVNDSIDVYLRVENLLNEQYQSEPGYGTSDRAVYLGLRSRF
jgi:vitamin B12 transporter